MLEPGRVLLIGQALGKALLILGPFALLAAKVVPLIMTRVARTQNSELFLLVALAIGLGTAALSQMVGLSLALGAFLAGLIISQSDYAHETLARLLSLRDVFVALFFVTIGVLIDPTVIIANLTLLGTIIVLIYGREMFYLDDGRSGFWLQALDGHLSRDGSHPDRRVLLCARTGRSNGRTHWHGSVQRHAGRLTDHHHPERGPRAVCPCMGHPRAMVTTASFDGVGSP